MAESKHSAQMWFRQRVSYLPAAVRPPNPGTHLVVELLLRLRVGREEDLETAVQQKALQGSDSRGTGASAQPRTPLTHTAVTLPKRASTSRAGKKAYVVRLAGAHTAAHVLRRLQQHERHSSLHPSPRLAVTWCWVVQALRIHARIGRAAF